MFLAMYLPASCIYLPYKCIQCPDNLYSTQVIFAQYFCYYYNTCSIILNYSLFTRCEIVKGLYYWA